MFATLFALLIGIYTAYTGVVLTQHGMLITAAGTGALLLILTVLLLISAYSPLQRTEQNSTPRLFELIRKDRYFQFMLNLLFACPFLLLAAAVVPATLLSPSWALGLLILLTGIGIDLLRFVWQRLVDYLNPFRIVDFLGNDAKKAIDRDEDTKLCDLIEAVAEVGYKATDRHNSALSNHAIDTLEGIGETFLRSASSLGHPAQNPELQSKGVKDTLSYVLILLLQHLETLNNQAVDKKLDLVAGHAVTTLAKLAAYAGRVDITLSSYPLHYAGKLAIHDMQRGFPDVGVKATLGLLELARRITQLKDLAYLDLKPIFVSLISILDNIAKESFKLNKEINIKLLTQPFYQLSSLLQSEPMKSHPDTPVISQQINRVLTEFQALEQVLNTIPPLPDLSSAAEK